MKMKLIMLIWFRALMILTPLIWNFQRTLQAGLYLTFTKCSISNSFWIRFQDHTLPDPGQVVDADATNSQKTTLKAISFPLMDEPDALPSSYITKVLQAVAKWSCKMAALVESFQAVDEPNGNLKTILFFVKKET